MRYQDDDEIEHVLTVHPDWQRGFELQLLEHSLDMKVVTDKECPPGFAYWDVDAVSELIEWPAVS